MSSIDLEGWSLLSDRDARRLASEIAQRMGCELVELGSREQADRPISVALFRRGASLYALVPGGRVEVGYDGGRFVPTPDQLASYVSSSEEAGLPPSINEYVNTMTSERRMVEIPSLLVAVDAYEAGLTRVDPDHPQIAECLAGWRRIQDKLRNVRRQQSEPTRRIEWHGKARVHLDLTGSITDAWLINVPTLADETARLAADGKRLLTPDEWEHACGAGSHTLFRWGDDCPTDRNPMDDVPGPHQQANAFGLNIAQDPYRDERTSEPAIVCGGDGGSLCHHEAGMFVCWLTLATSYRDVRHGEWTAEQDENPIHNFIRPAIALH